MHPRMEVSLNEQLPGKVAKMATEILAWESCTEDINWSNYGCERTIKEYCAHITHPDDVALWNTYHAVISLREMSSNLEKQKILGSEITTSDDGMVTTVRRTVREKYATTIYMATYRIASWDELEALEEV